MQLHKTYLVGGAVRDKILGIANYDRDWVVVGSTPDDLKARGFITVGKDFPVFLHPDTKEEYALARTERKSGKGYHGFTFHAGINVTLEEDLLRRDLTINAIAEDPDGNIIDPFNGRGDLTNKILRHVSPAFGEDPVRVLRIARFAAQLFPLGFEIADETMQLMQQMVTNGEIDHLVPERVWQEMHKALMQASPVEFIQVLRACGALKVLLPELDCLWGVPQNPKWHPEVDTGRHMELVMQRVAELTNDPKIRFAALLHDLGKGLTPKDILPSHHNHDIAGVEPIKQVCARWNVPKAYRNLATKVARWHIISHKLFELKPQTILKMLEGLDAFRNPAIIEQFSIACIADAQGRDGYASKEYKQAAALAIIFQAVCDVPVKPLLDQGFQGIELGEKLRELRVAAIRCFC